MVDVNTYNIRYYDSCYNDIDRSDNNENQSENSKKIVVVVLQERLIEEWLEVVSNLASEGFRIVVPEIIGFGYSDKPAVKYSVDFFLDLLEAFMEKINITHTSSKIIILGYSLGGQLAAEFAIRFYNKGIVEKLVLVAPTGTMTDSNHAVQQYIITTIYGDCFGIDPAYVSNVLDSELFLHYMANTPQVTIPEELIRNYSNVKLLPGARYAFVSTIHELGFGTRKPKLKGRLSQITCPSLILWGSNDKMVPIQNSKDFVKEIPRCKMHMIRDCGHIPHIEKPIEFTKIIRDYLLSYDNNKQEHNMSK